jgi:2-polyprenyl-3-methyl-5-hydroxy-6-metoxy-1,4-benzoquinol methylase
MTLVSRLLCSPPAVLIMSAAPVPLVLARSILLWDNARENHRGSWQRLRDEAEGERYDAVRAMVERYARTAFVLDIGCSQGILAEGLHYGRYLGIDSFAASIQIASAKADARTQFRQADAMIFVPDQPADAVVFNEVLYYLPDPLAAVRHHSRWLTADGVVIVSMFTHAWSTRRLLAQIGRHLERIESQAVTSGHLAWTVAAFRRRRPAERWPERGWSRRGDETPA